MADKEATVFVIDLGASMGQRAQERELNNLDWSMQFVLSGRKTDIVGVVGFRTDITDNKLSDEEAYHNITVLMPIQQILMPQIRSIEKLCKPQKTTRGDAMSALVVGLDLITSHCRQMKFIKNVLMITDAEGYIDWSQSEDIAQQINRENIKLSILGIDFDDAEFGFKEEGKSKTKRQNENRYRGLAAACDHGTFATMAEVIDSISYPRVRKVKPIPSYRGVLTLGDPDRYDDVISIDVERYPRTKKAAPLSASKYVPPKKGADSESQGGGVILQRTYKIKRGDEEIEVEKEELEKAYLYGRTIVNVSDADQGVMKLDTNQELTILGFVEKSGFKRHMALNEVSCIIGRKGNPRAQVALSSLIHALYEYEFYALARLVTKDDKPPVLVMMAPCIETDIECLVDVPFAEDIRHYIFAPLDKVITIKGKVLTKHRNLPTEEQDEAMSRYVDSMNLMNFQHDENGQPVEYLTPEDTYSPVLHRINQAVSYRAIHPDAPLLPPLEILTKYSHPPEVLIKGSEKALKKMIEAFDVKKVPPKKLAKRKREDEIRPISGLDVEALLLQGGESRKSEQSTKRVKAEVQIGLDDPVNDFKKLIDDEENSWRPVFKQMERVIREVVSKSFADNSYNKGIKALKAYRAEAIDLDEPRQFNEYLQNFKEDLLAGKLGGNRRDFWHLLKKEKVGLITYEESQVDQIEDIGQAVAEKFFET